MSGLKLQQWRKLSVKLYNIFLLNISLYVSDMSGHVSTFGFPLPNVHIASQFYNYLCAIFALPAAGRSSFTLSTLFADEDASLFDKHLLMMFNTHVCRFMRWADNVIFPVNFSLLLLILLCQIKSPWKSTKVLFHWFVNETFTITKSHMIHFHYLV